VGQAVVHPQRGVGQVLRLEEREFEPGVVRLYYEVSIPGGSTVWVPADGPNKGLRKLAGKEELDACRRVLAAPPGDLGDDLRARQSQLVERLKQGTIQSQCEVVRDLSANLGGKGMSGPIGAFLELTKLVLCQEWAQVEGVTLLEAGEEIRRLLEQGKTVDSG
jgi:RNA polymerase-interacting CarD/CdnL/TRCF family regulator